jgi:hypothetical protein
MTGAWGAAADEGTRGPETSASTLGMGLGFLRLVKMQPLFRHPSESWHDGKDVQGEGSAQPIAFAESIK